MVPNLTDIVEKKIDTPVEDVCNYKGQITRSKTKKMENVLLLKSNTLISYNFNDDK